MGHDIFKHRISDLNSLSPEKGNLLIAEPFMQDPYFKRAVVLLVEETDEGWVGLILNHALDFTLSKVLKDFEAGNHSVFLGGPVRPENLFFLHQMEGLPGKEEISKDLFWNGDFDLVKDWLIKGKIKTNEIRFFLGYSGWDKDQLQEEINSQSWLIHRLKSKELLQVNADHLWKHAVQSMGLEQTSYFANFPEDPSQN